MPKLDGFEVLELLDDPPAVVFCTAYDEFALKAFEVHAVDYLLKPFGRERFGETLVRVRERLSTRAGSKAKASAHGEPGAAALAAAARRPGSFAERLIVRDGVQVHVIPAERIDFLEAQDDYVAVHADGKSWLKQQPISEVAAGLDPARFVRVHRSYVVHLDRITRI